MPNRRKGFLFPLAIIIFLATTIAALRGPSQQNTTSSNKEDATPLQEKMTERQKLHGKLYGRHGRKDLRKTKESVQVVFTTPFIEPDNEETPPTIDELLQRTTCNADAVVIVTVENKTSQFTEDGGFVFTDYDARVQEILKNNPLVAIQRNETLHLTRPGGAVKFDGKIVEVIDKSFEPLSAGNTYLLFLRQILATGAYQPVNSEGSFALEQNQVRRLTAKQLPYPFTHDSDAASFLARIHTIATLCKTQSEGDAR